MSQKILHVCNANNFIPPFIDFVEENFGLDDHFFWINGDFERYTIKQKDASYKVKKTKFGQVKGLLKLVVLMRASEKVILHGLFNPKILVILFLMPWLLKKCYWVIWGGDLYVYKLGERNWKWRIREFLRRPVIKNMGHLVTYIPGDVEQAQQWYGAKGKYHECLMYPSNVFNPKVVHEVEEKKKVKTGLNILVGNSADPSNNHMDSLEKILPYREDDIKIFVPLSYGDQKNAKKIIEKGKDLFGEKFIPLNSFMAFDDYLKFLENIDIAVFNHKRQQAMGNTINLLGMGKKIFMRTGLSHYDFLKSIGLSLHDCTDFSLKKIEKSEAKNNESIVVFYFSRKNLKDQLSELFKS